MNIGYCLQGYPVKSQTWIPLEIQEFERRGHKVNIIDVTKPLTNDTNKLIKECEFLICHWSYTGLLTRRWGIPFGILCHAYDIWKDNGLTLREVNKSRNCKFVGCDTEYHRQRYKEWGIEKPLLDTPVCCDTEFFHKNKSELGDKIVAGGRDTEKKGLIYAIKGFNDLYLYGVKNEEYLKVNESLHLLGWISKEEYRDLMDESWLYVSPNMIASDGNMDGQPTTIKEALLMELQILTTDIAGTSELKYIHLSSIEDIQRGKYNIEKKRNSEGRQFILDNFSPRICIDKYISAIEQSI